MSDVALFVLLGLGGGAVIAGIAMAVVITYRGAGIINLSTGAVSMVAAYGFWALRTGDFGPAFATAPEAEQHEERDVAHRLLDHRVRRVMARAVPRKAGLGGAQRNRSPPPTPVETPIPRAAAGSR